MLFRHGLGRTDFYILNDPELSFREIVQKNLLSAVSGSFTPEMLEATKLGATKSEATKIDLSKSEATKIDITKSEVIKTETTVESTNLETENPIISSKSENDKTEIIVNSEIKLELINEPNENQVEKNEIDDSILSDKIESTNTEDSLLKNDQDIENIETLSNNENDELTVNNEKNDKEPETTNETDEPKEVSHIEIEQSNNKHKSVDKQDDCENLESTNEQNKQTNTQEPDMGEQIQEVKTVTNDNDESNTETINKEIKNTSDEIPSEENNTIISITKGVEQTVSSKECTTSVESVDRLKAMFPELEVVHKDISIPTIDKLVMNKPLQQIDQTIAHLLATSYQNPIKWPKVKLIFILIYLCYL